jgi:type I restriction enzyme S subunit
MYTIPEDWRIVKFKDIFDRITKKNRENNQNVLTISAKHGLISQEEFFNKVVASNDKRNYYILTTGDYAYNKSYSNGYPFGAFKKLTRYDKGIISPLYICFKPKENIVSEYYEHFFESRYFDKEINAIAQEGARNHGLLNISVSDFFNTKLPLPSIKEQKRIAGILSTWDRAIELKEKQLIKEKDLLLRAINSLVKENDVLEDKYRSVRLSECTEFINGYAFKSEDYSKEGDFRVITIGNVQDGELSIHSATKIISDLPDNINDGQILKFNDILLSMTGNVGRVCLVNQENCLLNQRVGKLVPKENIYPLYLYYSLRSRKFLYKMIAKAQGGAQPNLSTKDIKNHRISMPDMNTQIKVSNYLSSLERKTKTLSKEIELLKLQRKGLMQKLLTGKIRVQV